MTNLKEFAALVEAMRTAQRAYFRARKPEVLDESKRLECQVDELVKDILSAPVPSLFDDIGPQKTQLPD